MSEDPTLFDWAGGREAFDRMIDAFYDRVEQDDLLSPFFPEVSTRTTVVTSPRGGVRCSAVRPSTPKTSVATSEC